MTAAAELERAVREDGPGVLATLIRQFGGDFALAEDALQDAYVAALTAWEREPPAVPAGVADDRCSRRALDRLRRARGLDERLRTLETLAERTGAANVPDVGAEIDMDDPSSLTDDRLALLFTCCHPALALPARVALTVKSLGGLSTAQTAAAFLVSEPTMHQRLLRARTKIAAAGIPYRVPPDELLPERVTGVLATIYVVFTEGHTASGGPELGRPDLAAEAIRLARLLTELMPDDAEALGLLALMLLTEARRPARTDAAGIPIGLAEQNRALWDATAIDEGVAESWTVPCACGASAHTRSRRPSPPSTRGPRRSKAPTGRGSPPSTPSCSGERRLRSSRSIGRSRLASPTGLRRASRSSTRSPASVAWPPTSRCTPPAPTSCDARATAPPPMRPTPGRSRQPERRAAHRPRAPPSGRRARLTASTSALAAIERIRHLPLRFAAADL